MEGELGTPAEDKPEERGENYELENLNGCEFDKDEPREKCRDCRHRALKLLSTPWAYKSCLWSHCSESNERAFCCDHLNPKTGEEIPGEIVVIGLVQFPGYSYETAKFWKSEYDTEAQRLDSLKTDLDVQTDRLNSQLATEVNGSLAAEVAALRSQIDDVKTLEKVIAEQEKELASLDAKLK